MLFLLNCTPDFLRLVCLVFVCLVFVCLVFVLRIYIIRLKPQNGGGSALQKWRISATPTFGFIF